MFILILTGIAAFVAGYLLGVIKEMCRDDDSYGMNFELHND